MKRSLNGVLVRVCLVLPWLVAVGIAVAQTPAAPQEFGPQAQEQMRALQIEKSQLAPHQQKIDSQLRRMLDALSPSPKYPELAAIEHPMPQADGTIALDIDTFDSADVKTVVETVEGAGGTVVFPSAPYKTVRVDLAPAAIDGIARLAGVRFIQPAGLAITNSNTSEGDVTHRAAAARSFFGFDGTGVKVCVLSDGVASLAAVVASGDLPPGIDVLPGQAGSGNEGTAMLEIVHDLAPGAALGFATAFTSQASFAANIVALKNAGCHIIVDDVTYFKESPFQDLDIADAVNQVTAAGVLYFSSSANSGNVDHGTSGTWEGDFNPNGTIAALPAGTTAHNFGDGGVSVASTQTATNPLTLHWNDKFGQSANDYDMYVMDSTLTTIVKSSTNVQSGTQDPYEQINFGTNSGQRIVVVRHAGAATRMINLATNRGRLALATAGNTRGHNATANTVDVAATPAHFAIGGPPNPVGPYPGPFNSGNLAELFSSDGPRRMFFDFAGNFLPGAPVGNYSSAGGVLLQKPDITAADGVVTASPGFSTFYGTSAAAPHAAAIAALVKHAFPAMTNTQIRTALGNAAIDIEAPGWDRVTGKGIVMAYETLQALGAAGAPRTFVASTGDDAYPCTLTQPCRSFGAALALTIADGEIVVVDSAGYGPVVIDKAVTIVASPGVYAGISVSGGHGIDVNPVAGKVTLRGLAINGLGGDYGINLVSGDALFIERCVISGFTNTGIYAVPSAEASVFVRESTIRGNLIGAMFGTTSGASGLVRAQIERSEFQNNASIGVGFTGNSAVGSIEDSAITGSALNLSVNPTVAGATSKVTARKTTFAQGGTSGVRVGGTAGTTAVATLVKSQISESGTGLQMLTGGTAYLSDTTVVRNTTGITTASGTAISLGDNRVTRNGTNGSFSGSVLKQ